MHGFNKFHRYLIVVAVVLLGAGCGGEAQKKEAVPSSEGGKTVAERRIQVKTALIEARSSERSVQAIGTIYPFDEVVVSSEAAGVVDRIMVDLGDAVKAGDVLAVLETYEARLNLAEAEAAHNTAIKTVDKEAARRADAAASLKRYEELFKTGMASEREHDSAKTFHDVAIASASEAAARVKQTEARMQLMKKRLYDTIIAAPISGEIKKRHVSKGESVRDRANLFTIVSKGRVKFRGAVPEPVAPDIKKGQKVWITVDAFKDRRFNATLERVSPSVDADTRSLEIEAIAPNEDGTLKPGYFARGVIITDVNDSAAFAPEAAVYSSAGVVKVFVIRGGQAHERLVKAGQTAGGMVEITGEVKQGDVVAVSNLHNLYDGASVSAAKD